MRLIGEGLFRLHGKPESFTKITLPFLAPMIAITVMLRTIWIANFADLIYASQPFGYDVPLLSRYLAECA